MSAVAVAAAPRRPSARPPDFDRADEACAALLERIARGDEQALADLYDTTIPHLFGLAVRILKNKSAAEEVILEAYLQVWQQAASYNKDRGRPLTWLTIIARTRAIDRLRSTAIQERYEGQFAATTPPTLIQISPEENARMMETRRLLHSALIVLSPKERQVIELAYFYGLSQSEIARSLGEPLGTVKTRTRAGMRKLRDALAPVLKATY